MDGTHIPMWLHSWWGWVVSLPKYEASKIISTYSRIAVGLEDSVDQVEFSILGPGIGPEVLFFEAVRNQTSIRGAVAKFISEMAPTVPAEQRPDFEKAISDLVIKWVASVLVELKERLKNEIRRERFEAGKS